MAASTDNPSTTKSPHTNSVFLGLACILFAAPLIGFMAIGTHMRPTGDDYCYGGVVTRFGFWEAQLYSYTSATPYHGNRFALTFFSGISSVLGPTTNGFLPALVILLWLIGLAALPRFLVPERGFTALEVLVAAETLVFFTLYLAPDLVQSLYWRSGMLPYLAPVAAAPYLLILSRKRPQRMRLTFAYVAAHFLLAVLAGGFSETAAAMQFGLFVLVLTGALISPASSRRAMAGVVSLALVALVGTLAAILLLYLSPANQYRLANLPHPPGWISLAQMSLTSAYIFLHGTAKRLLLPHLAVFFVFFAIAQGVGWRQPTPGKPHMGRTIGALFGILLGSLLILVCLMAPSAWAQSSYPAPRALIGARFISVLAAGLAGGLLGMDLARLRTPSGIMRAVPTAMVVVVLGISAYFPLRSLRQTVAEWPRYEKWALFWDARDQAIRNARRQGIVDIQIVQIDHIVPNVGELQPNDDFWYNNCAEDYYDVRSLSADLPGWDD